MLTDADGFACLRVWANDASTYKVLRNGVIYWDYTVRFEILNKDGVCVVVNPPVVDLLEMGDEIEAQLELAEYFKMQDKRKARIAELEKRERHLEELFHSWRDEAMRASARIAELEAAFERAANDMRPMRRSMISRSKAAEIVKRAALKGKG